MLLPAGRLSLLSPICIGDICYDTELTRLDVTKQRRIMRCEFLV